MKTGSYSHLVSIFAGFYNILLSNGTIS